MHTASKLPKWAEIARVLPETGQFNKCSKINKCAEDDIGRNSVTPWVKEYKIISQNCIFNFHKINILIILNS